MPRPTLPCVAAKSPLPLPTIRHVGRSAACTGLTYLWGMCENNNSSQIQEKTQNAKTIQNLFEEKNMVEKKYTSLLGM
jgi:hypothetical protein